MFIRMNQPHRRYTSNRNRLLCLGIVQCMILLTTMIQQLQQQQQSVYFIVEGQILDITPGSTTTAPAFPTEVPTSSPTRYSVKLQPTIEPTSDDGMIPTTRVTLPPHLRGPTAPTILSLKPVATTISPQIAPSVSPSLENTNLPSTIPLADVVLTPTTSTTPATPRATTPSTTVGGSDSRETVYKQVLIPIISIIVAILVATILYVGIKTRRRSPSKDDHVTPVNHTFYDLDNTRYNNGSQLFHHDMNSAFDDSSVYTSSVTANSINNTKTSVTSNNNNGKNVVGRGGVNSVGGVMHQDLTEATIEDDDNEDDDDDNDDIDEDEDDYDDRNGNNIRHSTIHENDELEDEDDDDDDDDNDYMDDDDDDDDDYDDFDMDGNPYEDSTLSDNRTRESNGNSNISSVTPNTLENLHIGYMEEGIMIQERYDRLNRELYSSDRVTGTSSTGPSDPNAMIRQEQALMVAKSMRDASIAANAAAAMNTNLSNHSTSNNKKDISPTSLDQSIEVTFRRDSLNHHKTIVHYDDIVGVDNNSAMSYENSNDSSLQGSTSNSVQKRRLSSGMSTSSAKVLEILEEENPLSTTDFDDSPGTTKHRNSSNHDRNISTTQPSSSLHQQQVSHHPLSSISLFKRGMGKKGRLGSRLNSKMANTSSNVEQYKTDEAFHMTVPSVVLPSNSTDDQNSSVVDPFSEITTDFHGDDGSHISNGSSAAHIVLESIVEGSRSIMDHSNDQINASATLSSSCDSSVNNTHVYETDTDSNASGSMRRGWKNSDTKYNINLPADYNPNNSLVDDDGSANSQFDKLYESMSNEWEWKEPSQTIATQSSSSMIRTVSPSQSPKRKSTNSHQSSSDEVVRDLGNVFLLE